MRGPAQRFIIVLAMATMLASVATGVAVAGRRGAPANGATIVFDPSSGVVVGAQYRVSGSGFRPNTWVTVGARYDTVYWYSTVTDGNGSFSIAMTARAPGDILHEAKEQTKSGRLRLMASATLTVVPA